MWQNSFCFDICQQKLWNYRGLEKLKSAMTIDPIVPSSDISVSAIYMSNIAAINGCGFNIHSGDYFFLIFFLW